MSACAEAASEDENVMVCGRNQIPFAEMRQVVDGFTTTPVARDNHKRPGAAGPRKARRAQIF